MNQSYQPQLTQSGLNSTTAVVICDEYQNQRQTHIAHEYPLTLYLDRQEIVTLMTLGTHPEMLTLGYIKNQHIITDLRQIQSVQIDWETSSAAITTYDEKWEKNLGSKIVTSGCGQGTIYSHAMDKLRNKKIDPIKLKQSTIYQLIKNLNAYNDVYKTAGAVHGCALCDNGEILIFIEDVGRHNAVDSIAGKMWLADITGHDKLFYTTGRLTSEMIMKVAEMNISILLSCSGVTQMGLDIAKELNITLLSRVKGKHFLIYNGQQNIVFDVELPAKKPHP